MTNRPSAPAQSWPLRCSTADALDVRCGYLVLLGREVESRQALRAKLGRTIPSLAGDFLHSQEFASAVAEPLLSGRCVEADRFAGTPSPALRGWTADRLLQGNDARARARGACDWTALWRAIISDPVLAAAIDEALGGGEAAALGEALILRSEGLSGASAPPPRPQPDPLHLPSVSVVLVRPGAEEVLAACTLVDPDLPIRTELVIVNVTYENLDAPAWLEALRDAGRPVQHVIAPMENATAAALDVARGEYLLLSPRELSAHALVDCVRALVVHDRPEALSAGKALLVKADACARVLRENPLGASYLVRTIEALGGRVEMLGSAEALETAAR